MLDLLTLFKISLPIIAFIVSYTLQRNNFTKQMNAAIAATTIIITSIIIVAIQGKFTQDISVDVALISATIFAQSESFTILQQYLRENMTVNVSISKPEKSTTPPDMPEVTRGNTVRPPQSD